VVLAGNHATDGEVFMVKDIRWGTQDKLRRIMFVSLTAIHSNSIYHKKGR